MYQIIPYICTRLILAVGVAIDYVFALGPVCADVIGTQAVGWQNAAAGVHRDDR